MANTVAQIRDVLQARKNVLRERYQVESLFLFGSMCKGTQRPDSDICHHSRPIRVRQPEAVLGGEPRPAC